MTETGDWTVVKGEGEDSSTTTDTTTGRASSSSKALRKKAIRFPCLEQPSRFALRSVSNGYYLGGTKRGRLVGRKRRDDRDEWTIAFVNAGDNPGDLSAGAGAVTIQNHKFGGALSLITDSKSDMGRTVACVAPKKEGKGGTSHDLGLGESQSEDAEAQGETQEGKTSEQVPDDEDPDDDDNEVVNLPAMTSDKEDLQWCVVKCSSRDEGNNSFSGGVTIVSLKTGDSLGVNERGRIILQPSNSSIVHVWELECVTGELCFLSNPSMDARVRCDMAGLLSLSPNWKGWEVVRITEVASPHSTQDHSEGYVRITSWMHSQWCLCSNAAGEVSSCSVADSLAGPESSDGRCSKWAIKKYPIDDKSKHEGVIIRSVTHGRLLSIQDGLLKTYDSQSSSNQGDSSLDKSSTTTALAAASTSQSDYIANVMKQHTDEVKRKSTAWWKNSLSNIQKTMTDTAMQKRNSNQSLSTSKSSIPNILQEDTIVWQLEAAHSQTYYFLSVPTPPMENEQRLDDETSVIPPPRSIGAFPSVTDNLRKSDKIQLVRNDASPNTLKLYLPEENFFVTCSSEGSVSATKQEEDEGTDWILEEHKNGSVLKSKAYRLYLSFKDEAPKSNEAKKPPVSAFAMEDAPATPSPTKTKVQNALENLKLPHQRPKAFPDQELYATVTPSVYWKLEPCTPRAISSKRLKTFAIGTSIAVGTTIAMPFALAGVAAAMGAIGAEAGIGFGIVAAGLSGAEALASVGAIGATAYFCFRPEQNSLGDGMDDERSDNGGKPWSKRPFSNWRNW